MKAPTDEEFEKIVEQYELDTEGFRAILDERTDTEVERDKKILNQLISGKKMKDVLRKAYQRTQFSGFKQGSEHYEVWVNYYENFLEMLVVDLQVEQYYKGKAEIKALNRELEDVRACMSEETDEKNRT